MKASAVPTKFPVPFAVDATSSFIRPIPTTTTDPAAASLDEGFPPQTFQPLAGGGTPPDGRDMNGILNQATSWDQWFSVGGPIQYDATFSTEIGGYPKGAVVQSGTSFGQWWLSTADDNTSDPDTGGANWVGFMITPLSVVDTGSANAVQATFVPAPASLAAIVGVPMLVKIANANTIPNPTLKINTFTAVPITNPDQTALYIGQLGVGSWAEFIYDGTRAQLTSIGASPQVVPATGAQLQYVSGASLKLATYAGGYLWINGTNYAIPSNLTISNGGLGASAALYIYAYMNSGAMTLEASATDYTLNANGIPQKTGDATRTLVGFTKMTSGSAFQAQGVGTMSFFNRRTLGSQVDTSGSSSSVTPVELNSSVRANFVTWGDEVVQGKVFGEGSGTSGGALFLFVDGSQVSELIGGAPGGATSASSGSFGDQFFSEGFHQAQVYGTANTGTMTWQQGGVSVVVRG